MLRAHAADWPSSMTRESIRILWGRSGRLVDVYRSRFLGHQFASYAAT
jgi:hypothetical protein